MGFNLIFSAYLQVSICVQIFIPLLAKLFHSSIAPFIQLFSQFSISIFVYFYYWYFLRIYPMINLYIESFHFIK